MSNRVDKNAILQDAGLMKIKMGLGRAQLRSLWTSKCNYQMGICVCPSALLGRIKLRVGDCGGLKVESEAIGLVSQEFIHKN